MTGVPRQYHHQLVHFMRKAFVFGNNGSVLTVGTLPAGAIIQKASSGLYVQTVFNAGTNNFADLGNTTTADLYGTDLSLLATTFVPMDEAVGYLVAADIDIILTLQLSGTAATTGAGVAVVTFIPNIDG